MVLGAGGSRYQACTWKRAPAASGWPSAPGLAARKARKSSEKAPSHAPSVPCELRALVRCVGGFTHRKLEFPLPQGVASAPLVP